MIKLKELKSIYKMVRSDIHGLVRASSKFGISEDEIKLYIQSKDKLYPQIKYTISQCLPLWYLHELDYSIIEISAMNNMKPYVVKRLLLAMEQFDEFEVHREFSAEDMSNIIELRKHRKTYKEIADMYNTNTYNIKKVLEPYNEFLPKHVKGRVRQTTNEEIEIMKKLRECGYSYPEIANATSRSIATVFNYINGNILGGISNV